MPIGVDMSLYMIKVSQPGYVPFGSDLRARYSPDVIEADVNNTDILLVRSDPRVVRMEKASLVDILA